MGLHRKESRSFNGFGKILTKTIKITKTEIETKEKPQILHFQVKNTGFCQQSGISFLKRDFFLLHGTGRIKHKLFKEVFYMCDFAERDIWDDHCFRCEDCLVTLVFSNQEKTLTDAVSEYVQAKRRLKKNMHGEDKEGNQ